MTSHYKLANLTYRLHEQREKLAPGIELRRRMLEKSRHTQIRSEKEAIQGHIGKLQLGVRLAFLRKRMQQLRTVKSYTN